MNHGINEREEMCEMWWNVMARVGVEVLHILSKDQALKAALIFHFDAVNSFCETRRKTCITCLFDKDP